MGNVLSAPDGDMSSDKPYLPVEMLTEILLLVDDPMTLIVVCKLWRDIILSVHRFWDNVVVSSRRDLIYLPYTLEKGAGRPFALLLQFTSPSPLGEWSYCPHCEGRCERKPQCFHIFQQAEIDVLFDIIRPHFHRIQSLHLDYKPGRAKFANQTWALGLLSRFTDGMPMLKRLTLESFHSESLPRGFLNGDTPLLIDLRLHGQSSWLSDRRPDSHFLSGDFELQSFTCKTNVPIPYSDILSTIRMHSASLTSIAVSLPHPVDSDPSIIPSTPLTIPGLSKASIHGPHFIYGPLETTNMQSLTASIRLDDNGRVPLDSLAVRDYMKGLVSLFKFLLSYRGQLIYLDLDIGHYRKDGVSRMDQIILPTILFRTLTTLVICTNIPVATVLHQLRVPLLRSFDYTIKRPEGVSFAHILTFLEQCKSHLRFLRIEAARSAPYSMDLVHTPTPCFPSLATLFVRAPYATAFAHYLQRYNSGLTDSHILARDVKVPGPRFPA